MLRRPALGSDSEYGLLHDVLLCPPDNFRWRATSVISKATLASGRAFDAELAGRPAREMVDGLRGRRRRGPLARARPPPAVPGVRPRLERRYAAGPVVTQMAQPWRRGEYAPVIRFYEGADIPIHRMITAGSLEGGDVIIVEPGKLLIGNGEERTEQAGRRAARRLVRASSAGRCGSSRSPAHFVHIDVLVSILAPKLAAVCVEAASTGLVAWLRDAGLRDPRGLASPTPSASASTRSRSATDRVISTRRSTDLNAQLRALGLTVFDPDLEMFTLGGGGAHCLAQPLRRERSCGSSELRRSTPPA